MSVITAAAPAESVTPAHASRRIPSAAPSAIATGPSHVPYRIGSVWLERSCCSGNSRGPIRPSAGWNTSPEWAASWWATTTSVRSAAAVARLGDDVPGRAMRQRPPAKPAAAVAEVVPQRCGAGAGGERAGSPREPRRVPRSASSPPAAAIELASAIGHQ